MKWKTPVLFLCLAAAALFLLARLSPREEGSEVSYVPMQPLSIAVATDLHYLAPELTDGGAAFLDVVTNADGKYMQEIETLTDAFFDRIASERPELLILAGDLTFNGERASHEAFADKCAALEDAGIPVLVLPGNHDLDRPDAVRFEGDSVIPVGSVSAADFRALYAAFGYDEALSADEHSLSYVYQPCAGLRILLTDCNTSGKDDTIAEETFAWIEAQLEAAQDAGDRVIAVSHQTVLQHNSRFSEGFVITNRERLGRLYRQYHVAVNLSGHMHIQHTRQEDGLTEIVTGALSAYPCPYGVLRLTAAGGDYARRIAVPERLSQAAEQFFYENSVRQGLASGDETLARYLAEVNVAYFSGRMDLAVRDEALLRRWHDTDAFTAAYLESLLEDLGRDFTQIQFSFQE